MQRLFKSALVALWFAVLTFPVLGIHVNTVEHTVVWLPERVALLAASVFVLANLWDWCFSRKNRGLPIFTVPAGFTERYRAVAGNLLLRRFSLLLILGILIIMPFTSSLYQTNIMISALLYVMLALGLNIVVGLAGQLVLGYAAFYAVGAYTYGLLFKFFGFGFWACLPLGGVAAVIFGLALGFPVLRLRGDYLAIVTLGFGEIVRLTLQNWAGITGGPAGIADIPRPGLFGTTLSLEGSTTYIYYLVLAAVLVTILVIGRLRNSRVGLALKALREDEIACEAMGINLSKVKLAAFALGSCWAGFAGVIFAAKTTFINPSSFTFMDSCMILSMVVLGGMGSISGVAVAAMILVLAPEYLRAFSEYRMLMFGGIMVLMMIFRPQGLISGEKLTYRITGKTADAGGKNA